MDKTKLTTIVIAAFDLMGEDPADLAQALTSTSALKSPAEPLTLDGFFQALKAADSNDLLRLHVHRRLIAWDYSTDPAWAKGTRANTLARRARIYELLKLTPDEVSFCDESLPVWLQAEPLLVIAEEFTPWYTPERRAIHSFYWSAYRDYLREIKEWDETSLADLDDSTNSVVARISDPSATEIYQSKGLVVGYVQSGKTAHFTGVIAKAADAGYRLVIVLSGTLNLLRTQTQRRLDKELLGKELIRRGSTETDGADIDYVGDAEWDLFMSHGGLPSSQGAFDWQRLTGPQYDFQSLRRGIDALEFDTERLDKSKPFNDLGNLAGAKARLMVIKKNASVLKKVAKDLSQIRARLGDIPTLVIDDESDQASLNTSRREKVKRTAINKQVVELLRQLPRAQYVGYTATPFANVFVDPEDAADLFPKDFIISLRRPKGYMGIRAFHDLDGKPQGWQSNERAFIRDVKDDDGKPDNLRRALDSFVLSGALKLYREAKTANVPTRHHTMLVHTSQYVDDHLRLAERIRAMYAASSYNAGAGLARLQDLLKRDFQAVTKVRGPGQAMPPTFDELLPCIGECLRRIAQDGDPVLVVNGTERDSPDFDKTPVWKIILGGAKLSRGYTVEGLTISYYRRTAGAADTLMQMGRWFGFRPNYGDLVRLFIGREEPFDSRRRIDLYLAFEAVCRDEDVFRADLTRYAFPEDGSPPITPKQVPPLVPSHLSMLSPTATNKMYNAVVRYENFGGRSTQKTLAPTDRDDRLHNQALARSLVEAGELQKSALTLGDSDDANAGEVDAFVALRSPANVLAFLRGYRWLGGAALLTRELSFVDGQFGDPGIHRWVVLFPLLKGSGPEWSAGTISLPIIRRTQARSDRYGVYTDPKHVVVAEYLAGQRGGRPSPALAKLSSPNQGALLIYAVLGFGEQGRETSIGFAMFYPPNGIPQRLLFGVRDPNQPDAVVVPAAQVVG